MVQRSALGCRSNMVLALSSYGRARSMSCRPKPLRLGPDIFPRDMVEGDPDCVSPRGSAGRRKPCIKEKNVQIAVHENQAAVDSIEHLSRVHGYPWWSAGGAERERHGGQRMAEAQGAIQHRHACAPRILEAVTGRMEAEWASIEAQLGAEQTSGRVGGFGHPPPRLAGLSRPSDVIIRGPKLLRVGSTTGGPPDSARLSPMS